MANITIQMDFIAKGLNLYKKVSPLENITAYLYGRSYDLIDVFRLYFNEVLSSHATEHSLTNVHQLLEPIVEQYVEFFTKKLKECQVNPSLTHQDKAFGFVKIQNHIDWMTTSTEAYNLWKQYFSEIRSQGDDIDSELALVEFNNYLSHLVNDNKNNPNVIAEDCGVSHLYRSSLDLYKDVIYELGDCIKQDNHSLQAFVKLRLNEFDGVGNSKDKRKGRVEEYKAIVKSCFYFAKRSGFCKNL